MATYFSWMDGSSPQADAFENFLAGLGRGFLAGLLVAIIALVLYRMFRRRGQSRGFLIAEDAGDLFITVGAVREFTAGIVASFGEASLNSVSLTEPRGGYVLTITLDLLPETSVVPLRNQIRERIVKEAAERLGVQGPLKVNFVVRSLSASERKIAKASKKSLGQVPAQPEPDLSSPDDETEVGVDNDF